MNKDIYDLKSVKSWFANYDHAEDLSAYKNSTWYDPALFKTMIETALKEVFAEKECLNEVEVLNEVESTWEILKMLILLSETYWPYQVDEVEARL